MSDFIEQVFKRIDRANGTQSKDGKCLICTQPFLECNHSVEDVGQFITSWRTCNALGRRRVK